LIGQPSDNTYAEGIYVGYRYYGTFRKTPAYAFGHGLSYTTFSYGGLRLAGEPGDTMTATVTVTNTGRVPGREVVQLYVSAPAGTGPGALDKPERELRGFAKTRLLAPGASETIAFRLAPADLASFDPAASAWVADAGRYVVRVAASSADAGQRATFTLPRRLVVEQSRRLLAPRTAITELRPAR
jgi:beta-glucosidase